MRIGIDIRTLMDARYSGVSEYTLNLIKEILKLDTVNEYRLFYNCFGDCVNMPEFAEANVKMIKYNYPNKIFNYLLCKIFNQPKIDKELGVDVWFMPHINFIGMSNKSQGSVISSFSEKSLKDENGQYRGFLPSVEMTNRRGVKSLITIHDLSFLRYPEFFSARKNFWHQMLNVKKLINRFDCVVAVSENTKRDIVELCGVSPENIKVIYSGISGEFRKITNYPPAPRLRRTSELRITNSLDEKRLMEVKVKYNLPNKFILYLGTVEPRKNVDGIIKAYGEMRSKHQELNDVKLVIAGGRGWKSDNIYQEWEQSEFKDDIKFLGYVDSEDKVYLYNLAAVFVYPSFYEGFGLPPLEAMACGCPLVVSYSSSLPEVAGSAALMVDPYNINDIARAMREILTDESLRNKLIERGLERAKQFSWEKTAKEYLEILNN